MVKTKLKDLLFSLKKEKKAMMAFNLQNFYQLEAAKAISNSSQLPIIIQFSERYLRFLDNKYGMQYIVDKFSNEFTYFHLDHCTDIDFIKLCIDSGFDSVMYDGSGFGLDVNVENSKIVKEYAAKKGCLVEGELGKVSGVEDGFGDEGSSYAEIEEIEKYVKETKIDLMALGLGNAHGFYDNLEALDMNILKEANRRLNNDQLFVLHGGTGLPQEMVKEAINDGIVKINISTQIKKKTMEVLQLYISNNDLYNEISYENLMVEQLSELFESYLNNYTK